jgi:hypothetical protein
MKALTIKDLKKACEEEIRKGNGNKTIMISSDDEGNSYHYLWFAFTPMEVMEEPIEFQGKLVSFPFEFADERVAKKKDTIILG